MKKTKRNIVELIVFLAFMVLLTLCSRVIHEQRKPAVTYAEWNARGILPESCLYHIDTVTHRAGLYLLADTNSKRDPWVVQRKEVNLGQKTVDGYLVEANHLYGTICVVTDTSRPFEGEYFNGGPVRVVQANELEQIKAGAFSANMTKRLTVLLISCLLFLETATLLIWDGRKFYRECSKKAKIYYWRGFIKGEPVFLLGHVIFWSVGIFLLLYLGNVIGHTDYRFLHDWLPQGRVVDWAHYRRVYREWSANSNIGFE